MPDLIYPSSPSRHSSSEWLGALALELGWVFTFSDLDCLPDIKKQGGVKTWQERGKRLKDWSGWDGARACTMWWKMLHYHPLPPLLSTDWVQGSPCCRSTEDAAHTSKWCVEGSLGGSAVWRLPLSQGAILQSWDRVPHWAPCMEPASPSAWVSSSLSVSSRINKYNFKKVIKVK